MSRKRLMYVLLSLIIVYCAMREMILEWAIPTDTGPTLLTQLNHIVLVYNRVWVNYGVGFVCFVTIVGLRSVKLVPQQSIDELKQAYIEKGAILVATNPKEAFMKVFEGIQFKKGKR